MSQPLFQRQTRPAYDPREFTEDHLIEGRGPAGWLSRKRADKVLELALEALRRTPTRRVLDLGCGYGEMLSMLPPGLELVGAEINPLALAEARRRNPGALIVQADAAALPFAPASFDLVICSEVLEHVDDPQALAEALHRIIRPGGHICLSVPNETITTIGRFVLGKRPCKSPAHKTAFTPALLARTLGANPVLKANSPFAPLPFAVSSNTVGLFEARHQEAEKAEEKNGAELFFHEAEKRGHDRPCPEER